MSRPWRCLTIPTVAWPRCLPPSWPRTPPGLAGRYHPSGLLVFDDTGITGHPDHRAATAAAVRTAGPLSLPVLAWALPAGIADRLRAETGQPFAGQAPGWLDFVIRVSRARQRQAALLHASQVSPGAPLWRRLELQGDIEYLRWLVPPPAGGGTSRAAHVLSAPPRPARAAAVATGSTYEGPGRGGRPA